jgi:hypothetical protein
LRTHKGIENLSKESEDLERYKSKKKKKEVELNLKGNKLKKQELSCRLLLIKIIIKRVEVP